MIVMKKTGNGHGGRIPGNPYNKNHNYRKGSGIKTGTFSFFDAGTVGNSGSSIMSKSVSTALYYIIEITD